MLRLWAVFREARTLGRGGVSTVAKATGLSRTTIYSGLKDRNRRRLHRPRQRLSVPPVRVASAPQGRA